jgi:hypothetical protein
LELNDWIVRRRLGARVTEDKGHEKEQNCSVFLLFIGGVWIEEKGDCVKKTIGTVQEVSILGGAKMGHPTR